MQAGDKVLGFEIRFKLHEDSLALWVKFSFYWLSERTGLVPCVPVSPLFFVRIRQALCIGLVSPIHILTREDDVVPLCSDKCTSLRKSTSTLRNH